MPFKGTDIKAYETASKGKTPQERSKIYYKGKLKNQKKALKKVKKEKLISNFMERSIEINGKRFIQNSPNLNKIRLDRNKSRQLLKVLNLDKCKLRKEKCVIFDKTLEIFGEEFKDKITDFAVELIKKYTNKDLNNILSAYKTIDKYIKIANNIYKIIIKFDQSLNKTVIKFEIQENNNVNQNRYNNDYSKFKHVYDKYKSLNDFKIVELKDLKEWKFGTDKKDSDYLFELVKSGVKTAISYLYENQKLKKDLSNYSILTNWDKTQKILIETTKKNIIKFKDVSSEHAYKEGIGDRSLQSWNILYRKFFTSILAKKNENFNDDIKIVCEEFKVVKIIK